MEAGDRELAGNPRQQDPGEPKVRLLRKASFMNFSIPPCCHARSLAVEIGVLHSSRFQKPSFSSKGRTVNLSSKPSTLEKSPRISKTSVGGDMEGGGSFDSDSERGGKFYRIMRGTLAAGNQICFPGRAGMDWVLSLHVWLRVSWLMWVWAPAALH